MSDNENKTETVTLEQFNAQKAELEKLQKIFDERQTKALKKEDVLKKEEILKALGIEKDPQKDVLDLVKEQLEATNAKVEALTSDLTKEREALELVKKRQEAEKVAKELNFIDPDDALVGLDFNGDIEAQIKAKAEKKPHLIVKDDVGSNFSGHKGKSTTKDEELEAKLKALGILK